MLVPTYSQRLRSADFYHEAWMLLTKTKLQRANQWPANYGLNMDRAETFPRAMH